MNVRCVRYTEGYESMNQGILKGMNQFVATGMWACPESLPECANRSLGIKKVINEVACPGIGRAAKEERWEFGALHVWLKCKVLHRKKKYC